MADRQFVIIGGGPAGLAATYDLSKRHIPAVRLEKEGQVGGLSKTVLRNGYRFDIGGHRFFTKIREVDGLWHEILGTEVMKRQRLSRTYYGNKFFSYPLKPMQALINLGAVESMRIAASYCAAKTRPHAPEDNFEQWVSKRFGARLFNIFFKTYTEKVWGIPCTDISAEWAAQRIKGLSLSATVLNAAFKKRGTGKIKTLIEEFDYPRLGPG